MCVCERSVSLGGFEMVFMTEFSVLSEDLSMSELWMTVSSGCGWVVGVSVTSCLKLKP